jgi:F-type H+-transporting ATPase subunit b
MQLSAFLGVLLSGGSIIDLDGTVFVQLAMFFVAFVVLYVLVFKPMVALLDARDLAIEGAKGEAKHLDGDVLKKQAAFEAELKRVKVSANEDRERLRAEAQELERRLLETVRAETTQLLNDAKEKLDSESAKARSELVAQRPELARIIASRVLGREVQG